ncbi:hypothetical protein RHGRI_037906 [Rhododendron griersonianum]|uniref:Uncharacterized protein n=1 Tax=Rhododendron griersonianum TaxID=479676 RepID=A0AAV6HWB1_9ERIC|nr:hypothetical protein RHGRI_037906 [Rhododendron griersonianum]
MEIKLHVQSIHQPATVKWAYQKPQTPNPTSSTAALPYHLWYSSAACRCYRTTSSPLQTLCIIAALLPAAAAAPPDQNPLLLLRYDTAAPSSPLLLRLQNATHQFPSPPKSASPLQLEHFRS